MKNWDDFPKLQDKNDLMDFFKGSAFSHGKYSRGEMVNISKEEIIMAYIFKNKGKFIPIYQFDGGCDTEELESFLQTLQRIDIDELLAYPIAILNEKGYFTDSSCSGHLISFLSSNLAEDVSKIAEDRIFFKAYNEDGQLILYHLSEKDLVAYIQFQEDIIIASPPKGWIQKDANKIYFYPNEKSSCIEQYKQLLNGHVALIDWVEELPKRL